MRVKIKTWNRMAKEYGLSSNGNINVPCGFTKEMEFALPPNRIIEVEKKDAECFKWRNHGAAERNGWPYSIHKDMIEEYLNDMATGLPRTGIDPIRERIIKDMQGHTHHGQTTKPITGPFSPVEITSDRIKELKQIISKPMKFEFTLYSSTTKQRIRKRSYNLNY